MVSPQTKLEKLKQMFDNGEIDEEQYNNLSEQLNNKILKKQRQKLDITELQAEGLSILKDNGMSISKISELLGIDNTLLWRYYNKHKKLLQDKKDFEDFQKHKKEFKEWQELTNNTIKQLDGEETIDAIQDSNTEI